MITCYHLLIRREKRGRFYIICVVDCVVKTSNLLVNKNIIYCYNYRIVSLIKKKKNPMQPKHPLPQKNPKTNKQPTKPKQNKTNKTPNKVKQNNTNQKNTPKTTTQRNTKPNPPQTPELCSLKTMVFFK